MRINCLIFFLILNFWIKETKNSDLPWKTLQKPTFIHFDIEPHSYDEYDNGQRNEIFNKFIDVLEIIRAKFEPKGIKFAVDIPVWFDNREITRNGETRMISEVIQELVDKVVLMDYYNTFERITTKAETEIQFANNLNREVEVGVEVDCSTQEVNTFCNFSNEDMESILNEVNDNLKGNPAYRGIAIHHFRSLFEDRSPNEPNLELVPRSLWSWENSIVFYEDNEEHETYMQYLEDHNIKSLYQGAIAQILRDKDKIVYLLNRTFDLGVELELLIGDNSKSRYLYDENRDNLMEILNETVNFYEMIEVIHNSASKRAILSFFVVFFILGILNTLKF